MFRDNYRSHPQGSDRFPETSVRNYYSLLTNSEERSFPMTIDCIYISTANDPKKKQVTSPVVFECSF